MSRVKAIDVVYANWCPHCVPTTMEPLKKAAADLGIPLRFHDIDTADVKRADELVEKYGDWTPDYLIPQVFAELEDGQVRHLLTGNPLGVLLTRAAVQKMIDELKAQSLLP